MQMRPPVRAGALQSARRIGLVIALDDQGHITAAALAQRAAIAISDLDDGTGIIVAGLIGQGRIVRSHLIDA